MTRTHRCPQCDGATRLAGTLQSLRWFSCFRCGWVDTVHVPGHDVESTEDAVLDAAQEAFWDVVSGAFPNYTGDLPPEVCAELDNVQRAALRSWIQCNQHVDVNELKRQRERASRQEDPADET